MTVSTLGQNVNKVNLKYCEKKKGMKLSKTSGKFITTHEPFKVKFYNIGIIYLLDSQGFCDLKYYIHYSQK